MTGPALRARSLLFVPGDRPDMIAKLPRFAPDVAVVDLEDAVAAANKDAARPQAMDAVAALGAPSGMVVLVRINPPGSPWFDADLAAAAAGAADGIVLPKAESGAQVTAVRDRVGPDAVVLAGLETGLGVAAAREVLADADACYFGAEDYIADLGGRRTESGHEVLYARSRVVLAARLVGAVPLDQAVMAVGDDARFAADAQQGVELGYHGKICIHPKQVELAHTAFTPTPAEVEHALAVVAASAGGVAVLDGQMVDEVHVRLARTLLRRAGRD